MKSSPRSPRRGRALTVLAATATAAFLALGTAGPAFADPGTHDSGAKGKYTGQKINGKSMQADGAEESIGTSLFKLQIEGGGELLTYCIDYETNIRKDADYIEDQWENYPGKGDFTAGKVHWVLQNSYPTVDLGALGAASKTARLTEEQAIAGTQAAIWHFSNGVEFSRKGNDNNANALRLYDYLVKNAKDLASEEPHASLSIAPGTAEGKAGETIGKFTVTTSGTDLDFMLDAPEGVELVDLKTGKPAGKVNNGDQLGVKVPAGTAPGKAAFSATVESATVHAGRLFKGVEGQKPTQTLITAESKKVKVQAGAEVTWTGDTKPSPSASPSPSPSPSDTPSPSPSDTPSQTPSETPSPKPTPSETPDDKPGLPVTGTALGGLIAAAAVAIGGGGAAMYLARRRRGGNGGEE